MAKIINLKDPVTNETQYPITKTNCVYDENGINIKELLLQEGDVYSFAKSEYEKTKSLITNVTLEIGAIDGAGVNSSMTTRIRVNNNAKIYLPTGEYFINFNNLEEFTAFGYSSSSSSESGNVYVGTWATPRTIKVVDGYNYVRFAFRYRDSRTISNINELKDFTISSSGPIVHQKDIETIDITSSITLTKSTGNGTLVVQGAYRIGNIVNLTVTCSCTGSTSAGNDIWKGTINYKPKLAVRGVGFDTSKLVILYIGTDGSVGVRAMSAVSSGQSMTISISFIV